MLAQIETTLYNGVPKYGKGENGKMRKRVICFKSLSDLIEEVETVQTVKSLSMDEFVELCDSMTADEFWEFGKWLEKWGLM